MRHNYGVISGLNISLLHLLGFRFQQDSSGRGSILEGCQVQTFGSNPRIGRVLQFIFPVAFLVLGVILAVLNCTIDLAPSPPLHDRISYFPPPWPGSPTSTTMTP